MRHVIRAILKQSSPRQRVGAIRVLLTRTQTYYALINMPLILITAYTVREDTIRHYASWLTPQVVLLTLPVFVAAIALLDYKIIYPSVSAHQQQQHWKHDSPIRKELRRQKKQLTEQDRKLDKILERLEVHEKSDKRTI